MTNGRVFVRKLRHRVIPNLVYLHQSRFRTCGCCGKKTLIVSLSPGEERKLCIRCGANLRHEMIAGYLRRFYHDLSELVVVELDPRSPLRGILSGARQYVRTYFSSTAALGSMSEDGTRCEDITRLTLGDNSVDLMISSDVLEHVCSVENALKETARVLRPGGVHLFTVPTGDRTFRRAGIENGKIVHFTEAEYHSDPLNPEGILAFWNFGLDAGDVFSFGGLTVSIAAGPIGRDKRILWKAVASK